MGNYEYDPCILIQSKDACEPSSTPDPSKWNKCYWDGPIDKSSGSYCKNRCAVRETKGQCEQFYDKNQSRISNTIYNFDGKEHHCKWYPSYYNIDVTAESTDGKCRDAIPSTASQAELIAKFNNPGVNLTDYKETEPIYCGYNKVLDTEDMCIRLKADSNECNNTCEPTFKPRRAVSDGNMIYDQNGKLDYMDSEQCKDEYNDPNNPKCPKGCICMPSINYCKAKPINLIDPKDTNYPSCIPLQAQIPGNYDINLLEEEGRDIISYSSQTNIDPPYFTSKYLCDICHIRNEEIINKDRNDGKTYCERSINNITGDDITDRKPCKWIDEKCVSICNLTKDKTGAHENKPITNEILEEQKRKCSNKYQFYENGLPQSDVIFPNLNDYNQEIEDDYYNEMYCSWDGFECHNSIPCKYAQRINCEDNGYDWYEIHADDENIIIDGVKKAEQLDYPLRRNNKGDPIYGDMEGVCVAPNNKDIYRGNNPGYVLNNKYQGNHGILLIWSETGSPWWTGEADQQYLGENVIFIPFNISGDNLSEIKAKDIKDKINAALNHYNYYAMNGKSLVWARDIFDWCENEGRGFFNIDRKMITEYDKNKFTEALNYYEGLNLSENRDDIENELYDQYKIMNRVIYDLRGTINLIPTDNKLAKINIQTFSISPEMGKIRFEMKQDNQFHFLRFLEQDTDNDGNYKWQNLELHMFHKYIHMYKESFVKTDIPLYPKSIGHGYGSLYEYIRPTISIEYNNDIKTNIDYLTTTLDNYDNNTDFTEIISKLKNVIDEFKKYEYIENNASYNQLIDIKKCFLKEEGEEGLTFISGKDKDTNEFKQAFVYNLKKWKEQLDINKNKGAAVFQRGFHGKKRKLCNGSIESYDNYLKTSGQYTSEMEKITMNDLTPLVALMKLYNKRITPTDNKTARENIFKDDLRLSVLWSMTRNTHPFFGDLIYGGRNSSPDTSVFIKQPGEDISIYISIDDGYKDIYRKHLLIPFRSTDEEDPDNDFINWKVIMTYLGGNCNKIIRHMDLAPPSPINWGTMLTNNPSLLKANTIDKNRYYEQTYIDYINLTPHNPCMEDIFLSEGGVYKLYSIEKLNKYIIGDPTGARRITDFRDYYIPGKWLDPFKNTPFNNDGSDTTDIIEWHSPLSENDKNYIEGEANLELQKLKNVCFPSYPYPTPTSFYNEPKNYNTALRGQGWPQTGNQIENCNQLNKLFYDYGPGIRSAHCSSTGKGPEDNYNLYTGGKLGGIRNSEYCWKNGSNWCYSNEGGGRSWLYGLDKPFKGNYNKIQPGQFCHFNTHLTSKGDYNCTGDEEKGFEEQCNKFHGTTIKTAEEVYWDEYDGERLDCDNACPYTWWENMDPISLLQGLDPLSNESIKKAWENPNATYKDRHNWFGVAAKDASKEVSDEDEKKTWDNRKNLTPSGIPFPNDPLTFWKDTCGNMLDPDTDEPNKPIGWHTLPIKNNESEIQDITWLKYPNEDYENETFVTDVTITYDYDDPIGTVVSKYNTTYPTYPAWVLKGNNHQTCSNLLSYVPVIPTDTIPTISLDNCSLPVLTNEATSTADLLTNTLSRFINSASPSDAQTIRRICPETCQAVQCPKIPEISGNDLISFQLFTINTNNNPEDGIQTLFPLINLAITTNDINYGDDFWYNLYQNNLFVSISATIKIIANDPIKQLFTKSGMVTNIKEDSICTLPSRPVDLRPYGSIFSDVEPQPNCIDTSPTQKIPNKLNAINDLIDILDNKDITTDCIKNLYQIYQNNTYDNLCINEEPIPEKVELFEDIKCEITADNLSKVFCKNIPKSTDESPWIQLEPDFIDIRGIDDSNEDKIYNKDGTCGTGKDYIKLKPMEQDTNYIPIETFKPPKENLQSHIFRPGDENNTYHYGCLPKNMITWPSEYFKLNCNTNTAYPIQRDKYVMINYIIQHSKDKSLNISDRTKLAMMNEEELIEKAGELGISLNALNNYTRPQLISHVKDVTDPSGKFEKWDNLEKIYLNIDTTESISNPDLHLPKLGVKQWDYEGCSLDFNNALQKKSFESCKDKYPGLCKKHVDKCTDTDENIRKAIRTDCPETCGVQFSDFDDFKKEQSGILSICTDRGRCKWSGDQDDSNLLPYCEKKNSREYGDSDQCESSLMIPGSNDGLFIEGCEGKSDPDCNEKRCHSFLGCEYYKGNNSVCHIKNEASEQIINNRQCGQVGGDWVGTSKTIGQCILPERFDYNLPKELCIGNTRSWIPQTQEACLFNPHTWTPLEDPCGLPDDIDCFKIKDPNRCTSMPQCYLSNPTTDTINNPSMNICVPISIRDMDDSEIQENIGIMYNDFKNDKIIEIKPACTEENKEKCKNNKITPDAFELTMENDIPELYEGDYIYITRGENSESCSQFITGYSKVIQINRGTPLKIYIKGPNTPYTLDKGYDGKYDMGKCYITTYIKSYGNKDVNSHIETCTNEDRKGSCTMYTPVDNDETSPYCKSCSLIGDRSSCIINNKTSLCGWGEVEDICNVLGNIKECNDMYVEGCMWDRTKEQCVINQERDDDGDKSRTPMGCMKCGNIKHNHACNSLANCFWDNKTEGDTGICRACSEFNTMKDGLLDPSGSPDKDSCNNKSSRKCTFNEDKNRCESAQLYPLIYEWIWYNRWYLISLIACIYMAWSLPSIVKERFKLDFPLSSIVVFIIQCLLIFVTIPALLLYPGLTPADGQEGRNVYRDPPLDPKNIGYFDFLLGDSKNDYALWPARLYDERWDDVIMDDNYLRDMVDLRISKNSLDWTGYIKSYGVSWNRFVNSMGNTNTAINIIILLIQMVIFIIYILYNYLTGGNNLVGSTFLEINIVITIGLLVGLKILINSIENTSTKANEYDGRELDNPYTEDSLLHNFYIGSSNTKVCPYRCMVKVDDDHKICRDNRSVFALKGILDPDEKLDWINDPTKVKNIQEWIYNEDGPICPPAKIPSRWPYDSLCNDFTKNCISDIEWHRFPESSDEVKEKIKNNADKKCYEYKINNNNKCPKTELSITENTYSNDITNLSPKKNIQFKCKIDELEPDNCPFPAPPFILSNTDPFEQRRDINVWSYLYDKIAGPSPRRRIPPPSLQTWQNEERYEIVNQNFTNDKLFR